VDVTLVGLAVTTGVLATAGGAGWWLRRRDGKVRPASPQPGMPDLLRRLGVEPGAPATLLQFSSAFCRPCRATRVLCARAAADHPGVRHVDVDAESHLDEVRALGVWRTPTVFVLDAAGRPVVRVTGQPTQEQLTGALAPLLSGRLS